VSDLETSAPDSGSDDSELHAIWDRNNGPAAELRNPAMPADFAAVEGDHFKASWDWSQLPIEDRRVAAFVAKDNADLKKQAEALGVKVETMSDLKAARELLAGKDQQTPAIDADTKASLDLYTKLVPEAKSHREASQFLSGLVEHVQRDPMGGSRAVLQSLGVQSPLQLLTPQEWEMARQHLMGSQQPQHHQQQHAEPDDATLAAAVSEWSGQRGLSMEDRQAMAEIINGPSFRFIEGESEASMLERAHKSLLRSQARAGRDHSTRRTNASLEHDLRKMVRR
jgi:hypothetical protein